MTRVRVPGKEVNFAHVLTPQDTAVYHDIGLHIGTHEGEDHTGDIGFIDRFCGTLILTGEHTPVETAVSSVLEFFSDTLGFTTCKMHKN